MLETRDREVAERALVEALERTEVPATWRAPLAVELLPLFEEADSSGRGLGIVVGRWVIRDDDLSLLDWIAPVVISISAATVARSPAYTTSAVLGTIAAIFRFVRTLMRKGATLSADEARVLAAIKACDEPPTTGVLFERLRDRGIETMAQLEDALARLQEVRTRSGLVALVTQDSRSRWNISGV
ncbi:MAG: hypothetical protein IRZ16_21920 [Myxococcaceae bacterium]|nr:hypothetical protein [Myxococcaceae bacterium]